MTAIPELVFWLAGGIALGAVYLGLVARSVAALAQSHRISAGAIYLLLRMALAAGAFWAAATRGALPLLVMLAGFLIARTIAIRRAREADNGR